MSTRAEIRQARLVQLVEQIATDAEGASSGPVRKIVLRGG